jgi:hypothetical protein
MPDADSMYTALLAIRNEATDHHKNLAAMLENAGPVGLSPQILSGALADTASLLADLAVRTAEILSPEDAAADEEGDEEDDDEDDEVESGLEPEEAALFRQLLTGYRELLKGIVASLAETDPTRGEFVRNIADCERALGIVNDLELVSVDEEGTEPGGDQEPQ